MAPPLAPDEPFIRQKGSAMRKDSCYMPYVEALQCLDKHSYQQEMCAKAFSAFKACRNQQEEVTNCSRLQTFEKDPLLGWAFKLYNKWSAEQHSNSSNSSNSSSSSSSSSSSKSSQEEYQGWRPPPEESLDSSDSSNSSSSSWSKAFKQVPLWGWAFDWYNSSSAAEDSSSSSFEHQQPQQQPQQQPKKQQQS